MYNYCTCKRSKYAIISYCNQFHSNWSSKKYRQPENINLKTLTIIVIGGVSSASRYTITRDEVMKKLTNS